MKQFPYQLNGEIKTVTIKPDGCGFRVTIGAQVYEVEAQPAPPGEIVFEMNRQPFRAHMARDTSSIYVAIAGTTWTLARALPRPNAG